MVMCKFVTCGGKFFRYFLQFDWAKEVVTIRQLEPLHKIDKWWMGKHMCIEDPFDLDHNLAASIGPKSRCNCIRVKCA